MSDVSGFFEHHIICKLFHFQTVSGFRHTKMDGYITKFLLNFDSFMEVLQGQFGTINTTSVKINITAKTDDHIYQLDGSVWQDLGLIASGTRAVVSATPSGTFASYAKYTAQYKQRNYNHKYGYSTPKYV